MVIKVKYIFIYLIKLYQALPLSWHSYCRHYPTCSNYTILALEEYGFIKGLYLGIKRILKCNSWGSYGCDFLPIEDKKRKYNKIL